VVALEGEIGSSIEITSISWQPTTPAELVNFDELTIYMGLCSTDELGTVFEDNYIPGTKVQVYNATNVNLAAGSGWFSIDLDPAFFYPGTDNLIIDIEWPNGTGQIYTFNWYAGTNRTLYAAYGESTGTQMQDLSHLLLNGNLALGQSTFGAIKALFAE
jgi:hypothetical protein